MYTFSFWKRLIQNLYALQMYYLLQIFLKTSSSSATVIGEEELLFIVKTIKK